jgi:hypothetical protein
VAAFCFPGPTVILVAFGSERTLRDHCKSIASDLKRHFAAINCRIAKGSFALLASHV